MTPKGNNPKQRVRRKKLRIGLSMGTFNPIHLWHMQVAQCAWDQHNLDFVYFIPNGDPPHKKSDVVAKGNSLSHGESRYWSHQALRSQPH